MVAPRMSGYIHPMFPQEDTYIKSPLYPIDYRRKVVEEEEKDGKEEKKKKTGLQSASSR